MVRATRFASIESRSQAERTMNLARLATVSLTTLDGLHLGGHAIVTRQTLIILVDAYRTNGERIAADIGWVRERLDPAIELVLIWPQWAAAQARALQADTGFDMYVDRHGDFRRLVSPGGQRITLLADPEAGTLVSVTGSNVIFAVRRTVDGTSDQGADHMIDLGDVCH